MLHIDRHLHASSLAEAYDTFVDTPGSAILGGCGYLRLGSRKISTAIDLSLLGLDQIEKTATELTIGAMTSLRAIETHPLTTTLYQGVLSRSVRSIVGVQLRNSLTIGGTVAGRYPFSDPITALLALDAQIVLHHNGTMSLEDYLQGKPLKDIVVRIVLPKDDRQAAFASIRKTATDYAVLNVAVSRKDQTYRVIVGSRPGRAVDVPAAAHYLNEQGLSHQSATVTGQIAADNLQFGDNPRGSALYRKKICPVLVERALMEIFDAA